ncbi:hypothetical protein SO802_003948 [Lithocarpus litseifolius]|uniref:Uncharacterized protein n=1 Tax=Lithocarpus litseifolius TaxID=425828 RepID=A0AAW2E389_9ROSI
MLVLGTQNQFPPSFAPLRDLLKALMFLSNLNGFNFPPSPAVQGFTQRKGSSKSPLHSGAFTSSDPTPSIVQFRDKQARKDFSENFSRRGVHSERQVILSDFSDTDLPTVIHSRGWELLCDLPITCPSILIQEFYSNMHGLDYSVPLFHTCI